MPTAFARSVRQMTRHARLRTKEELGLPKWMPAVEGSFDDPPIVLRQDRLKLSLFCLGVAVVAGLLLLVPVRAYSAWHVIFLGFLGLGIAISGAMAMRPTTLILDPGGLTWRTMFRTFDYPWSDFGRFYVFFRKGLWPVVVAQRADALLPKPGWRRLFGASAELGSFWELPPQKVVDVLNEARARWGERT